MSYRKEHLKHTVNGGPTCQRGRSGGSLRGEHLTSPFAEFIAAPLEAQCERCRTSTLFNFLQRQAIKKAQA